MDCKLKHIAQALFHITVQLLSVQYKLKKDSNNGCYLTKPTAYFFQKINIKAKIKFHL